MKKNNLENKIIEDIYRIEEKNMRWYFIRCAVFLLFSLSLLTAAFFAVMEILTEQETFDLLNLFEEDAEIITNYINEVALLFWEEIPKAEFAALALIGILSVLTALIFIRKFPVVRHKIDAIKKMGARPLS